MKNEAAITWRYAVLADCPQLAKLNRQLIRDEGHRNRMNVAQLKTRMRGWLKSKEYTAVIFKIRGKIAAYALYRESTKEIYLRQLFVVRKLRRGGMGKKAMTILHKKIWPKTKRLTVEVLTHNAATVAFWRAAGYKNYSLCLEIMPRA